jgi:hypothetical protein
MRVAVRGWMHGRARVCACVRACVLDGCVDTGVARALARMIDSARRRLRRACTCSSRAGCSRTPVGDACPIAGTDSPHLRRDRAHRCHVCAGTGPTAATSAAGPGPPLPRLRRDRAHRCHICAGTGLTAATSAAGPGRPLPHLRRDWAHPCHICGGTGLTDSPHLRRDRAQRFATSAPGPGSPIRHICAGTGLTAATSAPPHLGAPRACQASEPE